MESSQGPRPASLDYVGTTQHDTSCPVRRRVYDTVELRGFWVGCKRRGCSCDTCHGAWRRRTVAGIMSGLDGPEPVLFLTLTAPGRVELPDAAAIARWNAGIGPRWTRVMRDLRRRYPEVRLEFARVRELQRRGAEHVHALIRGVGFVPQRELVTIATEAGFGRIVWVRDVEDRKAAASYLGSYLAKSRQVFPKGARVFAASRGWRRGWVKRVPEPGRFISGPPDGTRLVDWADMLADAGVRGRLRRLRERQDQWLASLEGADS